MTDVKLGDRTLTITRFRGLKGLWAMKIVRSLTDQWPEIETKIADYRTEYGERNKLRVHRDVAVERGWPIDEKEFDADGYAAIPRAPDWVEVVPRILPHVMGMVEKEALQLLALVSMPNSELEKIDREDRDVLAELDAAGRELLYAGDIDELAELAAAAVEIVQDQLLSARGKAGKATETPETSKASKPTSSTSARPRTAGRVKKSSSASRGAPSSPSPA